MVDKEMYYSFDYHEKKASSPPTPPHPQKYTKENEAFKV